jgi:hypothetical protein
MWEKEIELGAKKKKGNLKKIEEATVKVIDSTCPVYYKD